MKHSTALLALLIVGWGSVTSAQTIPIKTIPLATGSQFHLFPSQSLAMGGVALSLDDPLGDPYINPAAGSRLDGILLVASPAYYGISLNQGSSGGSSGRTLPVGILFRSGDYFGGLTWARQSLSSDEDGPSVAPSINARSSFAAPTTVASDLQSSHTNTYTFGTIGFAIPETRLSIGTSVLWGDLTMIDGLQYLYPGAVDIQPSGSVSEYRVGLLGELDEDRSFHVILSHEKTDMRHAIKRLIWTAPTDDPWLTIPEYREEVELDQTAGYGIRTAYQQPLNADWRIGGAIVGNWKSHPKIPNYELMNIPRDPGHSSAYQFGAGLSRHGKQNVLGFDLIYEPITSETWAEADAPVSTVSGYRISIGEKTVENSFTFYNHSVRIGVRTTGERSSIGVGVNLHHVKYYLKQIDHIQESVRTQKEEWTEFTLSVGLGFQLLGARVRYLGLLTIGTGRPGVDGFARSTFRAASESSFLVAPSGRLSLDEAMVGVHQVTLLVDLR